MKALQFVKLTHTAIWAFFVACILAIPIFTALSEFRLAALFVAIVGIEVLVLALNRMTCPLTNVAARYTTDRRPNFDIYLPAWLARSNKSLFGTLYVGSVLFLLARFVASG